MKRVLTAIAAAGLVLGAGCTEDQRQDLVDQAKSEVEEATAATACQLEAKAIEVAYATTRKAREEGLPDVPITDYLKAPTTYFVIESGETSGPVQRSADTLDTVTEEECPAIGVDKVPVGSR